MDGMPSNFSKPSSKPPFKSPSKPSRPSSGPKSTSRDIGHAVHTKCTKHALHAKHVVEGAVEIELCPSVFYNPHMQLSRSLSVLAAKAIMSCEEEKAEHEGGAARKQGSFIKALDAFTASGVRGLRYAKEAGFDVDFLDLSKGAVEWCKRNVKKNGVKGKVWHRDVVEFLTSNDAINEQYTFIELDPFGSPIPFLWPAFYYLVRTGARKRPAYLSITATDGPVLCGLQKEAARKYYKVEPLHNSFCHETGLRILIRAAAETALLLNAGVEPLVSFYYRHQFKTILRVQKGEDAARKTLFFIGRAIDPFTKKAYGPIWLGPLHDKQTIKEMERKAREAKERAEQEKKEKGEKGEGGKRGLWRKSLVYVEAFEKELNIDKPYFFSLPDVFKRYGIKGNMLSVKKVISLLRQKGYKAEPTHIDSEGVKTNASVEELVKLIKAHRR